MSEVYISEPATMGKVVLRTTFGDVDIELWSKECPKAARNFVQLGLEGYYTGTIFHRIVKDFIVQGGDPTGTGDGGASIFGQPFPNEIHSRLKFRYRGLVAMANKEVDDNNSQFFITLSRADCLNCKNTIFGKVTGSTIYNVIKMAEDTDVDEADRPSDPPHIISFEVPWNPFDDMSLRMTPKVPEAAQKAQQASVKRDALRTKQQNLLSFDEGDDDVAEGPTGMRAAHDLLDDPTLDGQMVDLSPFVYKKSAPPLPPDETPTPAPDRASGDAEESVEDLKEARNAEIRSLKIDILNLKAQKPMGVADLDLMTGKERRLQSKKSKRQKTSGGPDTRVAIDTFICQLKAAQELPGAEEAEESKPHEFHTLNDILKATEADSDDDEALSSNWLRGGGLRFAVDSARAYEIDAAKEALEVFDPLANASKEQLEEERRRRNQRMKPSLR